jgi:hypothetical protein
MHAETDSGAWRNSVLIGRAKHWDTESALISVSPTVANGVAYVPQDLPEAIHELEHMLPDNFLSAAAIQSRGGCLGDASENIIRVHRGLTLFLSESWFNPKTSALFKYLSSISNVDPNGIPDRFHGAFQTDVRVQMADVILCSSYGWKITGRVPTPQSIGSQLDSQVSRVRQKWVDFARDSPS